MKKIFRVVGIVVAVVVVLIVALAVVARILITPERVKSVVLPLVQEKLHREVALGEIEVSLFKGITLNDLVVREPEGSEAFIAADRVVLRYQLWPLLFRRVVVDEVRLEAPRIRLERMPDGRFNFSDLLPEKGEEGAEKPSGAAPAAAPEIELTVSEVVIADGAVLFLDRVINPSAPPQYRLDDLQVTAREVSLDREFPFTLKGSLAGAALNLEGMANPAAKGGRAKVKLADLDVTAFAPYYKEKLPGRLSAAKLTLDLDAEGSTQSVTSFGRVELKEIDLLLNALKDAPLRGIATLDYRVKADLAKASLAIEEAKLAFNEIPLLLSGRVDQYATAPLLDLTASLSELDLKKAFAEAPPGLTKKVQTFDPAGTVSLKARLVGPTAEPKKLLKEAEVRLAAVQVTAAGLRPEVNGALLLRGDALSSRDLTLASGGNRAAVDLMAANLFGKPVSVAARITADRFDLDPLLKKSGAGAGAGEGATGAAPAKAPEEVGPFDLPLRADATVRIGQTLYKGLAIEKFDLHGLLEKNVLTVDRLTGKAAGGSFNQTARVDLAQRGLAYATRLAVKGVQADSLVAAFAPKAAGTVFGSLDFDGDFRGAGTVPETLKQNLSGKGAFSIADGRLTGPGFMQGLADFLSLPALREMRFRQAKGSFTVDRGKVLLNSDFSGSDARLAPTGTVGLDGALDVGLDLRLSPELTGRLDRGGKVAQFFTDAQGWGQVPLKVTGTIGKPRFAFDSSAVREKAKEKVREEIQKQLQKKVLDKLAPREGEKEGQEPSRKMLDDTLKELFGR